MTTPADKAKTIEDLRDRLFATIDAVKASAITLDQARTISDLSQVIVNTAKVEVDYLRAAGGCCRRRCRPASPASAGTGWRAEA